jgi:threonine/homoserine/homoserine lactone efflux protein
LQSGRLSGLFSGLGAATADTIYALIAAFGLRIISDFLLAEQLWLRLIGGAFLLYLGWKTFFTIPTGKIKESKHTTLFNDFISTFFLTITNPMTILSFLAVFAALGLSTVKGNYFQAAELVFGVFFGSAAWWLIISEGVQLFRKKVNQKVMQWINRIAGLIIAGFGVVALVSIL